MQIQFYCRQVVVFGALMGTMSSCSRVEEKKTTIPSRQVAVQKDIENEKIAAQFPLPHEEKEPEEKELETRSLEGLAAVERNAFDALAKLTNPARGLRFGRDLDLPGGPLVTLGIDKASEQVMKELTAFKHLKSLMFCCPVSDAEIMHLPRLESLKELFLGGGPFGKSSISDAGLQKLYGLAKLERLQLGDTSLVTESGITALKKSLPKCQIDAFDLGSKATTEPKSPTKLPAHLEADRKQLLGEWNLNLQPILAWDEKHITFWIRFDGSGNYVLGFRDAAGKQEKLLDGDFTLEENDKQREIVLQEKAKPGGGTPFFKSHPYKVTGDSLTIDFNAVITLDLTNEESTNLLRGKKDWKRVIKASK